MFPRQQTAALSHIAPLIACLTDSPYVLGGHSLSLVPSQKDLHVILLVTVTPSLHTSVIS